MVTKTKKTNSTKAIKKATSKVAVPKTAKPAGKVKGVAKVATEALVAVKLSQIAAAERVLAETRAFHDCVRAEK